MTFGSERWEEGAGGLTRRQIAVGSGVLGLLAAIGLPVAITRGPRRRRSSWGRLRRSTSIGCAARPGGSPSSLTRSRRSAIRRSLDRIDYDAYQKIQPRPERSLWQHGGAAFPAQMFHLGRFFKLPVAIHVVVDGEAREVLYSPEYLTFGDTGLAEELPADLGFAGFRIMDPDTGGPPTDWLAFLGAAYFRSSGELDQYGLSARAVAIDTAQPWPEEFPRFTQFWLEPHAEGSNQITIYALMDGPSLTGALPPGLHQRRCRGHRRAGGAVHAQGDRAPGHRADDQHVLVRRERPPLGRRLAPGDPRQRRAVDLERRRRASVAADRQSDRSCA